MRSLTPPYWDELDRRFSSSIAELRPDHRHRNSAPDHSPASSPASRAHLSLSASPTSGPSRLFPFPLRHSKLRHPFLASSPASGLPPFPCPICAVSSRTLPVPPLRPASQAASPLPFPHGELFRPSHAHLRKTSEVRRGTASRRRTTEDDKVRPSHLRSAIAMLEEEDDGVRAAQRRMLRPWPCWGWRRMPISISGDAHPNEN